MSPGYVYLTKSGAAKSRLPTLRRARPFAARSPLLPLKREAVVRPAHRCKPSPILHLSTPANPRNPSQQWFALAYCAATVTVWE